MSGQFIGFVRRLLICLGLPACLLLRVGTAWAGCSKDTDCKGDRICVASACVSPAAATPPAATPPAAGPIPDAPAAPPPAPALAPELPPAATPVTPPPPVEDTTPPAPVAAPAPPPPPAVAAPPAPPEVTTFQLTIESNDNAAYVVAFTSTATALQVAGSPCSTPCTLRVPAGHGTLIVSGARNYEQEIFVPEHDTTVSLKRSCVGCYFWGSAGLAAGISMGIALAVYAVDHPDCGPYSGHDLDLCHSDADRFTTFEVLYGIGSATLTSLGIVGLATGAAHGPSRADVEARAEPGLHPHLTGVALMPVTQGGAASVRFSF